MIKEGLPKNWVETTIGDIYSMIGGGTPSKGNSTFWNGDIPWASVKDISRVDYLNETVDFISAEGLKNSAANIANPGDVIIGTRMTVGKPVITNIKTAVNQDLKILKSVLPSSMTFYWFKALQTHIESLSGGTTVKGIRVEVLKSIPFPLPPLPEQQRIVAKLDQLFASLETVKARMEKIPDLLKQFRQAVLTQAVTGKLTEEWREGKELLNDYNEIECSEHRTFTSSLPELWVVRAFKNIAKIESNLVDPNRFLDFPLIAPDNIEKETGRLINLPLVSDINPISSKNYFASNSIIYSKIRPYLSKLVLVDFEGLCSADMYPISTNLHLKYLFFYMLTAEFLDYASTAGERTVLPKINQKALNIIPVPVPPFPEQTEIVRRVEALFSKADRIHEKYILLKEQIDHLPQTILAKAFRGELVEQLPTDGDARELLKEIAQLKVGGKKK